MRIFSIVILCIAFAILFLSMRRGLDPVGLSLALLLGSSALVLLATTKARGRAPIIRLDETGNPARPFSPPLSDVYKFVLAVGVGFFVWSVMTALGIYVPGESGRWSWLLRALYVRFGAFGLSAFFFFIAVALLLKLASASSVSKKKQL